MYKYFLLFALAASLSGFKRPSNDEHTKVVQAANEKLSSFLANIPAGSEGQFGLTNRDEIKIATLGNPYHVLVMSKEFYDAQSLTTINNTGYITESNEWRVPVKVKGDSRLLMTVNVNDGKYTAGDIGGAGLAHELQQMTGKPKSKHTYYILRIYSLTSDFLVDAPGGSLADARFIPLASARMAMPALTMNKAGYSLTETLNAIKEKLNK